MDSPRCLLVDDEPDILELLRRTLEPMGIACTAAETIKQARSQLKLQPFELCLTDMKLPDGNGIDLAAHIQSNYHDIPVAIITAHGNMESAISALKKGAFDFISKPVDLHSLRNTVNTALKLSAKQAQKSGPQLIGSSSVIRTVRAKIAKLARSQAPAYISGESGTGKELAARMIHAQGPRADKPFVPVNCGAIPNELMESEFFGHKKGSFTGAIADKSGLFQAARSGTLFLDEVADLPLAMQVKLLRAIQEKQARPVGAPREEPVDVRILSATHKDLAAQVQKGQFRQDLFYRINVIELHVPSLRERTKDIPELVDAILTRFANTSMEITAGEDIPEVTPGAMEALEHYVFPGNVRELENILERAITLCENNKIQVEDLQLPEFGGSPQIENLTGHLDPLLDDVQKETILNALEQTRWNKTKAAKLLGISFG
ncbi:MAG: sigma-54-dependent Fis family transcriptional regulator, partial [Gammaproteobacteria bacterium]|nr:sigma-54-dependent Fis family transcriptional regulator [Gammaproteobacteria bacterium]